MATKKNVLLIGSGAVGTIAAVNLEHGGLAAVTAVLRSNYEAVNEKGFKIESVDHGHLDEWRPTSVLPSIPDLSKNPSLPPYDYIVCTTKNCPDISPTLVDLLKPAVTPSHTVILLLQNGLNIERPFLAAFPTNILLSGVSMIDAHEAGLGHIKHEDHDLLHLGAFRNSALNRAVEEAAAKDFIVIYGAAGKTDVRYNDDVPWARWRKLVFNACLNPICAITGLDDARIRLATGVVDGLVLPAMREVVATAKKLGYDLPENICETMLNCDPMDLYLRPSMQCDAEKGNYIEYENLVGEPLREAEKAGVPTPTLKVIYHFCQAAQWRTMEAKGLIVVPPKRELHMLDDR